jgi:membrane-associated phospholipid phosphatase
MSSVNRVPIARMNSAMVSGVNSATMAAASGATLPALASPPPRARHASSGDGPAPDRDSIRTPLLVVGLSLIALALTWVVTALVPAGQFKDAVALHDFTLLDQTRAHAIASTVLALLKPRLFVVWALAVIAVAVARRRPHVAVAVLLVLALTPLSAELLKPLLAHPHVSIGAVSVGPASWPSGHASAALALALCAVLVVPGRWRPLVAAVGAAFAVLVGCSLLILAWHMPSDVLGGYLLAVLWTALALAGLRAAERRWPIARSAT